VRCAEESVVREEERKREEGKWKRDFIGKVGSGKDKGLHVETTITQSSHTSDIIYTIQEQIAKTKAQK